MVYNGSKEILYNLLLSPVLFHKKLNEPILWFFLEEINILFSTILIIYFRFYSYLL